MPSKKSFEAIRREKEQEYHKRFIEPIDEGLRILDEKKRLAEKNPEIILKDPYFMAFAGFSEKIEKTKSKLEQGARHLLLAHAGGAVLTINMLPSIMENKVLLGVAANSLDNFTMGLVFLLLSFILVTFNSWASLAQGLLKAININSSVYEKFANYNIEGPALFFAGVFGIVSFLLFVVTIYSAGNAVATLV